MSADDNLFYVHICPDGLQSHLAGILDYHEDTALSTFRYVRSYRNHADLPPIAPMPEWRKDGPPIITQGLNRGLPGPFRDALPDYWGTLVYAKRQGLPVEAVQFSDLLQDTVQERPGFLAFSKEPELNPSAIRAQNLSEVPDFSEIVQAVEALEKGDLSSFHLQKYTDFLAQKTSMGGARPKLSVFHNGAMWLAKLPAHRDSYDVGLIEQASMTLAQQAGIRTPQTELRTLSDGRHVFLSRRFDRAFNGDSVQRLAMVSGLSLLGLDESENCYGSYPDIARHLMRLGDARGASELFQRMVFNWLIRNTDDHLRNHAVIREARGAWRLSPVYDINPSPSRPGLSTRFDLSIALGAAGRHASLANALSDVEAFGLGRLEATHIVRQCGEVLVGWRSVLQDLGFSQKEAAPWENSFFGESKNVLDEISRLSHTGNRGNAMTTQDVRQDGSLSVSVHKNGSSRP